MARLLALLLLSLAGCDGLSELACRLEGDAAGQLAGPVFATTACLGYPCTPQMRSTGHVWNPASEAGYQDCRRPAFAALP
jgi:hypothetical protein